MKRMEKVTYHISGNCELAAVAIADGFRLHNFPISIVLTMANPSARAFTVLGRADTHVIFVQRQYRVSPSLSFWLSDVIARPHLTQWRYTHSLVSEIAIYPNRQQ